MSADKEHIEAQPYIDIFNTYVEKTGQIPNRLSYEIDRDQARFKEYAGQFGIVDLEQVLLEAYQDYKSSELEEQYLSSIGGTLLRIAAVLTASGTSVPDELMKVIISAADSHVYLITAQTVPDPKVREHHEKMREYFLLDLEEYYNRKIQRRRSS